MSLVLFTKKPSIICMGVDISYGAHTCMPITTYHSREADLDVVSSYLCAGYILI